MTSVAEQSICDSTPWLNVGGFQHQVAIAGEDLTYAGLDSQLEQNCGLPLIPTPSRYSSAVPMSEQDLLPSPEVPLSNFDTSPAESDLSREQSPLYYGSTGYIYEDPCHYNSQVRFWPAFATQLVNDEWMSQYPYDTSQPAVYTNYECFSSAIPDAMLSQHVALKQPDPNFYSSMYIPAGYERKARCP